MKLSIELEHLIKESSPLVQELSKFPERGSCSSLSEHLASIDARKALEVEHFLRACALRLDLGPSPVSES